MFKCTAFYFRNEFDNGTVSLASHSYRIISEIFKSYTPILWMLCCSELYICKYLLTYVGVLSTVSFFIVTIITIILLSFLILDFFFFGALNLFF